MTVADTELLTGLREVVDPAHTALLVIDMQNDFCAEDGYATVQLKKDLSPCRATVAPIMRTVEAARGAGVPVLWVRAHYDDSYIAPPMRARNKMMGATATCCAEGSWGADFFGVEPAEGEPVINKHRFNAFFETGLHERLQGMGVRSLVLTGVQTNVCIESTYREAFSLGYFLAIPEDGVASHTPPSHEASMANFRFLFGEVTSSDELTEIWADG
jgi:ureidoacrylate peracid hydrolase